MSIKMIVTIAAAAIFLIVFFQIATHRLNEEKAFDTMKLISSAQRACKEAKGRYGTLKELADAGLIKSALSDGRDGGDRFEIRVAENSYSAVAVPEKYGARRYTGTGGISLYVDETGVIRGEDKGGREANANDPPW
jgi:hypothetical protein